MGSWDVHCQASRMPIRCGSEAVLIPLVKKRVSRTVPEYEFASLPFFGIYDDYGRMETTDKSKYTELIENHYSITIEQAMNKIDEGWFDDDWSYMWVRRDVYDYLSTNNLGSSDIFGLSRSAGDTLVLKELGFTFKEKRKDARRYNQKWVHPNGAVLDSDGTWSHLEGQHNKSLYHISDYRKYLGMDVSKYYNTTMLDIWWKHGKEPQYLRDILGWDWTGVGRITDQRSFDKLLGIKRPSTKVLEKLIDLVAEDYETAKTSMALHLFSHNCHILHIPVTRYINFGPQWADLEPFEKFFKKCLEFNEKDQRE